MRAQQATNRRAVRNGAFTLIELVVVVVIIAIIAAIAIPKMSRGSAGAADSALAQNLSTMRAALELYQTEHGGSYPTNSSAATLLSQLTQYTDATGAAQATKDSTHIYGPYLKSIPALPVGTNKGQSGLTVTGPAGTGQFGWYYDGANFYANNPSSDADVSGTPYNTY